MSLLATALGLSVLGSFGGLLVAASLLLFNDNVRRRLVPWLVSYAVGALLGVALLALLPEALETLHPTAVFGTLLAGILSFFITFAVLSLFLVGYLVELTWSPAWLHGPLIPSGFPLSYTPLTRT